MPSISTNKDGGVIRWDESDWLAGLVPHYFNSQNLTYGKGFAFTNAMNPWRRPGYLMPGAAPTDATNVSVVDSIQKNAVVNSPFSYSIGGSKIQQMNLTTNTFTTPTTFPHTIVGAGVHAAHTGFTGSDVVVYYVGTTKYLFYSYWDNTDWDVGRYDFATTFVENYMTGTAASPLTGTPLTQGQGIEHPMIVGDDNILYIANGKDVCSFQGQTGANGTFNSSALDLPNDYVITSFAKTSNYLVIYAYKNSVGGSFYRGEATAFFWDYVSSSFTYSYPLLGNYVNGGFSYNGTVGCFTYGRNPAVTFVKPSKMLIFNGSIFETVMAFPEDLPGHGGVEVGDDGITFNAGGVIYQYGTPHIGYEKSTNRIAQGSGSTINGMCKNLSGSTLFASTGATTSGGFQYFSQDFAQSASWRTPSVNPAAPFVSKFQIQYVKVYWGSAASAGSNPFTLQIFSNRGVTATTVISALDTITSPSLVTKYEKDSSGANFPIVESIQLEATYGQGIVGSTPPFVQAVEVYYQYINVN